MGGKSLLLMKTYSRILQRYRRSEEVYVRFLLNQLRFDLTIKASFQTIRGSIGPFRRLIGLIRVSGKRHEKFE